MDFSSKMHPDSSLLVQQGFAPIGSWTTPYCTPYRSAQLRYKPGLYAFVIGSSVKYVGMSSTLHRRLRNYGNRTFRNTSKMQRTVHVNIAAAIRDKLEVLVFAKVIAGADETTLLRHETTLITAFRPPWNGTFRKCKIVHWAEEEGRYGDQRI